MNATETQTPTAARHSLIQGELSDLCVQVGKLKALVQGTPYEDAVQNVWEVSYEVLVECVEARNRENAAVLDRVRAQTQEDGNLWPTC